MCIPPWSQAPWCASHRGVKLRGVHHTQSQTAHPGVKIEILVSLWLLLKGEILLGVTTWGSLIGSIVQYLKLCWVGLGQARIWGLGAVSYVRLS